MNMMFELKQTDKEDKIYAVYREYSFSQNYNSKIAAEEIGTIIKSVDLVEINIVEELEIEETINLLQTIKKFFNLPVFIPIKLKI
jgi:hypothetical protein